MNGCDEPLELAGRARSSLQSVMRALLAPAPQELYGCKERLESAVESLQQLKAWCDTETSGDPRRSGFRQRIYDEMERLRSDLAQVRGLLHHAGGFYLGWARLLLSGAEAYTSQGEPAPLAATGRLHLDV